MDGSLRVGILEKHGADIAIGEVDIKHIADEDFEPEGNGAGSNHGERLRVKLVGQVHFPPFVLPGRNNQDIVLKKVYPNDVFRNTDKNNVMPLI